MITQGNIGSFTKTQSPVQLEIDMEGHSYRPTTAVDNGTKADTKKYFREELEDGFFDENDLLHSIDVLWRLIVEQNSHKPPIFHKQKVLRNSKSIEHGAYMTM